jgi:hypothetical protein
MNAYELADKVDLEPYGIYGEQAANMLRQQADRIAELEKDLAKYDELAIDDLKGRRIIWCDCGDAITQDSGAVCGVCASFRSTKEQSVEPVAWMHKESGQVFAGMGSPMKPNDFIPLYTTPQIKDLSDAEISQISHRYHYTYNPDYVGFARAILKKASEK